MSHTEQGYVGDAESGRANPSSRDALSEFSLISCEFSCFF